MRYNGVIIYTSEVKMHYNEIETGNNDVKIGNNGLIELECCFGRDCCLRELVQYRFLHDH